MNTTVYLFDEFRLEAENLLLLKDSEVVALAPKAVEVLKTLIEAGGKLVTKQQILDKFWADTFVEESNLPQHVSALRKALGEDKNGRKFIETILRRGYRFVAEVKNLNDGAAEIVVSERTQTRISEEVEIETGEPPPLQPENIVSAKSSLPPVRTERKNRRRARLAGLFVVAVLAAIGFGVYKYLNPAPRRFAAKNFVRLTSSGRIIAAVISPDGKFVAYTQEELDRRQSLRLRHLGSESGAIIAAPAVADYRGLAIAPDGNALYYLTADGSLFQIPTFGGAAKKIAAELHTFTSGTNQIGVSPDGKQIAFVRRIACFVITAGMQNALIFHLADGTFSRMLPQNIVYMGDMAWLPDSKGLLMSGLSLDLFSEPKFNRNVIADEGEDRYSSASLTADGKFLSIVKNTTTANVWTMPSGDVSRLRQFTTGTPTFQGLDFIGFMPDGKILHSSTGTDNTTYAATDANGSEQLIKDAGSGSLSPVGRDFAYQKYFRDSTPVGLFLTNLRDGGERRLTTGVDTYMTFPPDGKTIFYIHYGEHIGLWKISVEGGDAREVMAIDALCPTVSPDGKTIALVLRRPGQPPKIALVPAAGGVVSKIFEVEIIRTAPNVNKYALLWTADGRGVYFLAAADGGANIWRQPVDGSAPPSAGYRFQRR